MGGSLSSLRQMLTEGTLVLKLNHQDDYFIALIAEKVGQNHEYIRKICVENHKERSVKLLIHKTSNQITILSHLMAFEFNCKTNLFSPSA